MSDDNEHDLGHGVVIRWDADAGGIMWKHHGCRAWFPLRFKPDARSTGHELIGGNPSRTNELTIRGSLLCPIGCGAHGEIRQGRWWPC